MRIRVSSHIKASREGLSAQCRRAALMLAVLLAVGSPLTLRAAPFAVGKAVERNRARQRIPFQKLTPAAAAKIRQVVEKPTLYRRMPTTHIVCDPRMHRFLIRYPEVVVNIWQLMGITRVNAERTDPFVMNASDGVGTVTKIELVYGDQDTHLMYCDGYYEGPLFKRPLKGQCVLLLKSDYVNAADGTTQVTNAMDVFLHVDNVAIDVVTRTLHPLLGRSADINFTQSTQFIERIWRTTEENGPGMMRLAQRLDKVQPSVRDEFTSIAQQVHLTAQSRDPQRVRR